MGFRNLITTTLLGNRLGLQKLSSAQLGTGAAGRNAEFMVGAEDVRKECSTADSTGTYLKAWGVSLITTGLSASDTPSYRLDPPIPGVEKVIVFGSTTIGTMSAKINVTCSTGGAEGIQTSNGSSFTVFGTSAGAVIKLIGITTALWATNATTGAGFTFSTST